MTQHVAYTGHLTQDCHGKSNIQQEKLHEQIKLKFQKEDIKIFRYDRRLLWC